VHYVVICLAAFLTSGLTLFSGFGLGTLLLPVFALFFPVELAVALTAVVHLGNNLFKLALLGRQADKGAVLRLGVPALPAAYLGALTLLWLANLAPLYSYHFGGRELQVLPVKLVVAALMVVFALMEFVPALSRLSFGGRHLVVGGVLSGFFGGLSGHQGALRSAFLVRAGLSPEAFVATGVAVACLVDVPRVLVYGSHFSGIAYGGSRLLLAAAVLSAWAGASLGRLLLRRVTMRQVQYLVAAMLLAVALALGSGLI
jgi:hypothetical protein